MDPNLSRNLELWTRFVAGEELSPAEEAQLAAALRSDEDLRDALLRDQSMDWLLTSLHQQDQADEAVAADDFVACVLKRCQEQETPATPQIDRSPRQASSAGGEKASVNSRLKFESPRVQVATSVPKQGTGAADGSSLEIKVNGHDRLVTRPTRNRTRRLSPQILAVACAFLFLLGVGALAFLEYSNQAQQADNSETNAPTNESQEPKRTGRPPGVPIPREVYASLTGADGAVWQEQMHVGERLGGDEFSLLQGTAELTFDDGAVVNVVAPATFKLVSDGEMRLERGDLSAVVPPPAVGFLVTTPTSRIVDLGTEFDVAVEDSGATDVLVRLGEVTVTPNDSLGDTEPWRLVAEGLNQATVFERVAESPESPVASVARSSAGHFQGAISVNGKSMQFDDPEAFENVRKQVFSGFMSTPGEVMQEWADFVESFSTSSGMQGSVTVNGVEVGFGNLEEAMRLQQKVHEEFLRKFGSGGFSQGSSSSESFAGSLSINGKVMTFTSREEYEAAKRELFGPAAAFGAGKLDDK